MKKQINENTEQHNTSDSKKYDKIKSKSRLIYSTVQTAKIIRHNHKTNLNLPPANWLKSEGELYGMRYKTGDLHDFSSFQIANMFSEHIGKVDIVSNARNIKNLFKMAYDKKSVSIIVHRIENTLLLDELDVEKHLINVTNEKWNWLRKYFYNKIVKSTDTDYTKVKCITYKQNDFSSIQHKALVSKFLHHSIALDSHNDQIKNNIFHSETSPLVFPLPKMIPEDVFPNCLQKHQLLFNRTVLWCFDDLQMLIGTDLPVFENGNNTSLSSRLRDMTKPLSKLTGIDYWLDNLICDIPQIEFCYHINGIVQKYELVKTEELPYLNDSTFSPKSISINMQNIISVLKSNARYNGHTYWLFKGKNDSKIHFYDLTTFCFESISPNPFTVPIASLLYHIVCKLKHNSEDGKPYNPVTVIHLLNNCLKLLDKTKYPQAVISINYMLSDIFTAVYYNPLSNAVNNDLACLVENYATTDQVSTHFDNGAYSVDVKNENISFKKKNISQIPEYSAAKVKEKSLHNALYYIGCSLSCLQYFKNDRDITVKPHLRRKLFENAADIYFNLGRNYYNSKNYGIALRCFRRSLECQLCVNNTHIFYNTLGLILEYCGNCFLTISSFCDNIEQQMSEFETDQFYDAELRETLIRNSKDFTNKDLNLILTKLSKSIENMLSAAEHCYSRALTLGTDVEKKTTLNIRLGIVYEGYTKLYMSEIINSIEQNNLNLLRLKFLRKKSEQYFILGCDTFKKFDHKHNFVQMHINLAHQYRYIADYSSKCQININKFMEKKHLKFKAVNIYTQCLSELQDRSSDPILWDSVFKHLSSDQLYLSVQNYLALNQEKSKNYKECIDSFMIALKYCDLENDTHNRTDYEYQAAYINLLLATLYSDCFENSLKTESSVLLDVKNYYNNSFELYYKIKRPLESLEVLVNMIALDMRFIDSIISIWHIEPIKSIIKTLGKCDAVFRMFLETDDTYGYLPNTYPFVELTIGGKSNFKMRKLNFLKILKENVCMLLKYMIKMATNKTFNWLADKEDELKTIYRELLRNTVDGNDYSQLMTAVEQLSRFSDN